MLNSNHSLRPFLSLFCLLGLLCGVSTAVHAEDVSEAVKVQIALDRANFSPGAIDGLWGANTRGALSSFQEANGLEASGELDDATREALKLHGDDLIIEHTLTDDDLGGPFVDEIPESPADQAKLERLAYTSAEEAVAERFHVTEETLRNLNPGVELEAGASIRVPNVPPMANAAAAPDTSSAKGELRVVVTKSSNSLRVVDAQGTLYFYAPVTAGSEQEPLPLGRWTVEAISINPQYHYDPDLVLGAEPDTEEASLPPGPNNPVGVVWIGIDKEHYGLHGTPEPSEIGHTKSSGCVRLTNWDAKKLAYMVAAGTQVTFQE